MARIVLIEDDPDIRRLVAEALASNGFDVETAGAALEGLGLVVDTKPDLVILDQGLPDLDGRELLRMIRAISQVPVVIATARGSDEDIVGGLEGGADDYLVKPFSTDQLLARIRAVLRRGPSDNRIPQVLEVGGLSLDPTSRTVFLDGKTVELSPKEFDLLRLLVERSGEVLTKRELLAEVWRQPYGGGDRTVDVHISWLRKKLGETALEPRYLRTVHGVGIKLVAPEQ